MAPSAVHCVARLRQRIGNCLERRIALNLSIMRIGRIALLVSSVMLVVSSSAFAAEPDEKLAIKKPVARKPVPRAPLTRADVNQLMLKARQEMLKGKLTEADSLVRQAEGAKVSFPILHFGDTPAKVRRDLKKLMSKQGKPAKGQSSPAGPRYSATKTADKKLDPFQSQTAKNAKEKLPAVNTLRPPRLAAMSQTPNSNSGVQHVAVPGSNAVPATQPKKLATSQTPKVTSIPTTLPIGSEVKLAAAIETQPFELSLPKANSMGDANLQLAQAPTGKLTPLPATGELLPQPENAFQLLQGGENALRQGDRTRALQMFREAHTRRSELDVVSQQKLQDHLQMLSVGVGAVAPRSESGSLLNSASSGQKVLARQLSAEIGKRQTEAAQLRTTDPQGALRKLQDAKSLIANSELDEGMKTQLHRRVDLSVVETERFIRDHGADIELEQANLAVLEDIDRQKEVKRQVRERLAALVDEFNTLRNEHRYAQAEIVAKRAYDIAPNEQIAQQIWEDAKFLRRSMLNREIAQISEAGVYDTLTDIKQVSADTLSKQTKDITYGDSWPDLVKGRKGSRERGAQRSASELQIQQRLQTKVLPRYTNMPLTEVVQSLSELTGVNIYLDPRGLGQEGVRSETPVSLELGQEISLESALNLILEPLHLTYMIKNEVLKVTSDQIRDGEIEPRVYNVADLVVPIPNFVPTSNMGLQGLINDAYEALPNVRHASGGPVAYVPGQAGLDAGVPANPNVLQQQQFINGASASGAAPLSAGPGGAGGAAAADFDSLIDLIISTVEHDSWMENGTGEGEIQPFPTNLSLVISQTERVHEQIVELLDQLRRLQDLQVTIEVRFIRLTDSFFERIGIDFDFNIEDGGGATVGDLSNAPGSTFEPPRPSSIVGISSGGGQITDPLPDFTVDLDVPFRNSSFGLTVPGFGGPNASTAVGEFGFAILSDIEAFFLINASQGDTRANVLQAPKVTLFNGQQAIIVDTAFTPFVISVIPVVGEFAAAQQPVIVVLSEGTMMTVQAVVSDDRRYVRLTLVPFFSQIGDVDTFTFEGSQTTTTSSDTTDQDDDGNNETDGNANTTITSGTTVQLPTFEVISVATTVSVPDGGTVLLGGIKRLREGRSEFGVPLLSKVPYIDRLFRNVGIGRETDSLMMMVTPHIIIQEEEEERLGIAQ